MTSLQGPKESPKVAGKKEWTWGSKMVQKVWNVERAPGFII